jgi:uncharacterized membrane protein
MGTVLLLMVVLFPRGLMGLASDLAARLISRKAGP